MQKTSLKNIQLLRRVFYYVKPYKYYFFIALLLSIVLAFFSPIRPYLIQLTINFATQKEANFPNFFLQFFPALKSYTVLQIIIGITIFQIVFLLIETSCRFVFSFLMAWLGQSIVRDLRNAVYEKILQFNLQQFDKTPIGTLTTRTINDIESINDIFSDGLIPIITDLLSIVVTLAMMFYLDWQLTLISLIPFPILIVATYLFKESVKKSFLKVRNAVAALNAFVQERIAGMFVVHAFTAEKREQQKFDKINQEHRDANISAIFAYSVFFPIVEIVLAVSIGIIVWYVADKRLDAGILIAFVMYINQIFKPLRIIADKFNTIQMGLIASERVFTVLDNEDIRPKDKLNAQTAEHIEGKVTFEHVYFAYEQDKYVLKDISLHIQPGEVVALVGHTGSGKTSIIHLINRLYTVNKGVVKIDDLPIEDYNLDSLRKKIGIVLQDVFLFAGTIKENITLRNSSISDEKVIETAKLIGVDDFIQSLPNGYDFNVMERGNSLSLGQRQLISFIRAVLYNPSILIMDEATSSVDTTSEILVQRAIEKLITGRTAIIIAHRLSTIQRADKIVVLDKGKIVEIGTHDSLLAKKEKYFELYTMQLKQAQEGE